MNILITTLLLLITTHLSFAETFKVEGEIEGNLDISAISCMSNNLCILASDETNVIQTFSIDGNRLKISKTISLGKYKKENDIEGITNDGEYFYLTGSHGLSRKKGKYQPSRYKVFRLKLSSTGRIIDLKVMTLEKILSKHSVMKNYLKKKKNGVDIEGLAYSNGKLFFGFRSPIIKGKAAILSISTTDLVNGDTSSDLQLIDLDGHGIRSMEFQNNSSYIISGPSSGNSESTFLNEFDSNIEELISKRLLYKNGKKPEAMEVFTNDALILHDSIVNGRPTLIPLD